MLPVVKKWRTCNKCENVKACNHVFYRGASPCDILFIGDAPGVNEDMCGLPIVGSEGDLLNSIVDELNYEGIHFTYGVTDVLSCLPVDAKGGVRLPTDEEVDNCRQRVIETIYDVEPIMVCFLGKLAKRHTNTIHQLSCYHLLTLPHPRDILKSGGYGSVSYLRSKLYLKEFIEEYYAEETTMEAV